MKNKLKIKKNFRFEALAQMFLLVFSIVAFSYAIGGEVKIVSGVRFKLLGGDGNWNTWDSPKDNGFGKCVEGVSCPKGNNLDICGIYGILYSRSHFTNSCITGTFKPSAVDSDSVQILSAAAKGAAPKTPAAPTAVTTPATENINAEIEDANLMKGSASSITPPAVIKPAGLDTKLENKFVGVKLDGADKQGFLVNNKDGTYSLKNNDGSIVDGADKFTAQQAAGGNIALTFNSGAFAKEFGANLLYTLAVYGAVKFFGGLFGIKDAALEPLSKGAALGFFVASNLEAAAKAQSTTFSWATETGWFGWQYSTLWGVGIGAAYALYNYREVDSKTVQFNCIPWQAPIGGNDCEKCNAQKSGLPCSEYQCRSLGQSCQLVNKGTTKEICAWVNRNDVNPPVVEVFNEALLSNKYKYNPDGAILPPDRGVSVEYSDSTDKCIPAFTPLKFGVSLNEPGRCKIDSLRKDKFENMTLFMDQGMYLYNHTFSLALPGTNNLESEGITVQNNGNYQLFVRCEDSNGNANIGTFVFKYCVQKGPDTTPPLVISTSIPNNMPVAFNQSSVALQVYTNEPAECKWSHNNRDYNSMETQMTCNAGIGGANSQGLYTCETTLDGLKDRVNNQFFFRCKDKPNSPENERNENSESFQFTIIGTQSLVIDSVAPNGTISDSTTAVKVTLEARTSAGFDKGNSTCHYSNTGEDGSYVQFFNTNSFKHSQDLFLSEGFYTYYIRCLDLGGNAADEIVDFDVETDNSAPVVARAYHEENYMKIITDEDAQCVYDNVDCNYPFSDGIKMTNIDGTNHFADWNIKTNLYVKCRDNYGNEPLPNACSITVKSSNL